MAEQDDGAQAIQNAFENLSFKDAHDDLSEYVRRPGFGRQGRPIQVAANMFPVNMKNNANGLVIYHYDIDFRPEEGRLKFKKTRDLSWRVWKKLVADAHPKVKKELEAAAYDQQSSFYTPFRIPMSKAKSEVPVSLPEEYPEPGKPNRDQQFIVTVQFAREIDLSRIITYCKGQELNAELRDMVAMGRAAINILLRQDLYDRFTAKGAQGRRFYTLENSSSIGSGGVVLEGFIQSFLFCQAGHPAIQLDTAYGPFFRPDLLINVLTDLLGGGGSGGGGRGGRGGGRGGFNGRGGPPGGFAGGQVPLEDLLQGKLYHISKLLKGAKCTLTYSKSKKPLIINGFLDKTAAECKFDMKSKDGAPNQMITVSQYFHNFHNITLKRPRLPLVKVGNKSLIPLELIKLCDFNAIPFAAVTADQTAEMIRVAAKPPPERSAQIIKWRSKINYSQLPRLKDWGIQIQAEMMRIPARVLPPPVVHYAGREMNVQRGSWNVGGVRFLKPGAPLRSWSICCFDSYIKNDEIKNFFGEFINVLVKQGCSVEKRDPPIVRPENNQNVHATLRKAAQQAHEASQKINPQIIFVIVPRKDLAFYSSVKRIATNELKMPVVTQIMQSAKVKNDRGRDQYCGNMSMKVHAKLGGITHTVKIPQAIDKTTMLVGADVSHPPQLTQRASVIHPSIAVTVAAINGDNNFFVPCIRLQEGRKEMVDDLKAMMKSHIELFEKRTGAKPQKILMFRDGVSEGQYGQCATTERDQILAACREMDPKYRPKITFTICAKRHHMRFFAVDDTTRDRTGNLPPGTCVDTAVTHPFAFDFYLQAHAGLQGTARPTHYVVVVDENAFSADKMQDLCNSLCYSYARTAKAVSLIPVCYYADIIAGKARDFAYPGDESETATVTSQSSGAINATFDPYVLRERVEKHASFNHVAWVGPLL
ncbi:uncharacterized protein IL334_001703 [Kwoniella shivajii]|uniref:Argonaute n=1 Tax=Kwoniella shivajii TaxID=564305 RepID=A0ABZ1CTW1_9TREE|nr:hypothetical protein IL334_001703 [Kwoniella shivajii]